MKSKTTTRIFRDSKLYFESVQDSAVPTIETGDPSGYSDFAKHQPKAAGRCIYCGSKDQLSREHVIAYGLGGTVTIPEASCESCRKKTHSFETAVLRGPMRMVRYIQKLPSRTKHSDVPLTLPVNVTVSGQRQVRDVPREKAPILVPFPLFNEPSFLDGDMSQLKLRGTVAGSFGVDPEEFCKTLGAQEVSVDVPGNDAIAFARLLAKTAYGDAYIHGLLGKLEAPCDLVSSFMDDPNSIGRFVGTSPDPFQKFPGMQHRLSAHILLEHQLLFYSVQLFASIGAPTYIVVLGRLKEPYVVSGMS